MIRDAAARRGHSIARAPRSFVATAIAAALLLGACRRAPEIEPVIVCAHFDIRVDEEADVNEARRLMHALAIEFDTRFVDEMPRWGANATIQFERVPAAKFTLMSDKGPWSDKRAVRVVHTIGGFPIHDPAIRSVVACDSGEAEYFARVEAAFRARWPDGMRAREGG